IRARKTAGTLPEGAIEVVLQPGAYELETTFELATEDGGTELQPITYRAAKPGKTRLMGGRLITNFQLVTDEAELALLDESARGKVWKADLKKLGVTDFGKTNWSKRGAPPGLELFFDDRPMTLSRWPNEGFSKVVDTDGPVIKNRRNQEVCRTGRFVYGGERPERWVKEKDAWVHGYWYHDWSDQRHPIAEIDVAKHVIAVKPPLHNYGYRKGKWFYAFNLLCEIDSPGEWYLDRDTGALYFWPPHTNWKRAKPSVSMIDTLISMRDTAHVTIRGMVLESCRATAVIIRGGTRNRIAGCTIRNTGAKGVSIRGGTWNGVLGCDITDTALGGVSLGGGNRKTLTRADLYAVNNHIWHYGRWQRMYTPAVGISGVGNRVANNLMHDAPHQAIGFRGNDHIIELNEIHSVCHESNDAGAIYGGCNWSYRGTHIRNNYMHHIEGFRGRGCVGVYLDDILSGHHIDGNVFYRVTRAAFLGGGSDCTIDNNVFVDCKPALHVDARGMGKYDYGASEMQPKRLRQMPYQKSPWKEHYPRLVGMLEDEPQIPKYNRITHNICVGGRWDNEVNKHAREHGVIENNLVNKDPLFVNPIVLEAPPVLQAVDFAVKADSPAWALGIKALPLDKMGLYNDEFRASWPVEHQPLPS
ncbi:MAG: right-handed parallel beta-helix repeat-containing protein, partial [Lentisphaeria bacterium]|nr:right-handed parallel beta-helix repeat-containing protein [Lentisphaeria bacterium]